MIRCMYCHKEAKKFYMYQYKLQAKPNACCLSHCPSSAALHSTSWTVITKEDYLVEILKEVL